MKKYNFALFSGIVGCIMSLSAITPQTTTETIQANKPELLVIPTESTIKKPATIGVYYFDGWAGKNRFANDPNEPWAKNAPTHLTRRFVEEFSDREPVWGWRDDDLAIMERQIDLAADNGVDFFLFCWYWKDNKGPINVEAIERDHHHTSMELFMKAKNRHRRQCHRQRMLGSYAGCSERGRIDKWFIDCRLW
jgi:hypothetical protein